MDNIINLLTNKIFSFSFFTHKSFQFQFLNHFSFSFSNSPDTAKIYLKNTKLQKMNLSSVF